MRDITSKFSTLQGLIGNTPTIKIFCQINDKKVQIYAKYEVNNFSGSIKDRMTLEILRSAYHLGVITPRDTIVEATSGNTGISLAALGAYFGHPVIIYMPDWLSNERKKLLQFYGAKLIPISAKKGGFLKCIELAEEKSQKKRLFWTKTVR